MKILSKRETEATVDWATISPDRLTRLMSEVISLRERVAQAELVANRTYGSATQSINRARPNCSMLKGAVPTKLLN